MDLGRRMARETDGCSFIRGATTSSRREDAGPVRALAMPLHVFSVGWLTQKLVRPQGNGTGYQTIN